MKLSLKYKAALLIAIAEFALLGLLVVSNMMQTRQDLEEQLVIYARSTAELIADSVTEPLLGDGPAQLQNLLQGIVNKYRIRHITVTDPQDRLLAEAGTQTAPETAVGITYPITVAGNLFGTVHLEVARAETEAALADTTQSNLIIAALAIFLAVPISLTLGWFLTRNIGVLSKGAKALSRGDYRVRVQVNTNDEAGELAKHFNNIALRLENTTHELNQSHMRFRDMADNVSDWLWETDLEGRYTYTSPKVETVLGYTPEQIIGISAFEVIHQADTKKLEHFFRLLKQQRKPFYGFEFRARNKDGNTVMLETNGSPIIDASRSLVGYRGVTRDITRRKGDESRLLYLAEHDALTGLLSRHKFLEILEDEIRLSPHSGLPVTVLFIDLDDFRLINDTHGHMIGDSLLRVIADILLRQAGEFNVIARLGGDEFGVLLRGGDPDEGVALVQRILPAIESTQLTKGETIVHLSASIGICSYPDGGEDSETLLAHADIAMSRAKSLGHNRYHVYQASDKDIDDMRQTVNWQTIIHDATERDRLYLHFQPIVGVSNGTEGHYLEALVRMRDGNGKTYTAAQFINTAEHTGQIAKIDMWVLQNILKLLSEPEHQQCVIAMNLSGRSLGTPGFLDSFQERLFESGVHPNNIVFELTESAAIAEMTKAESLISIMKKLGYRFSLDDFGVGFSSFSYLKHLPVDQIKIDGSFIRHLDASREDQIFVNAIVQVAHELGLMTVAEFVETQETMGLLFGMGVDYVQGYHIGKPGPTLATPMIKRLPRHVGGRKIGRV